MQTRNGNYEVVCEMKNYYFSLVVSILFVLMYASCIYIFYSRALELYTQKCVCGERAKSLFNFNFNDSQIETVAFILKCAMTGAAVLLLSLP